MSKYNTYLDSVPKEAFHGYTIKKSLGSGVYGEAFLTNNNQVVKVTGEKGEHLWAKEMIGHKCKHVVDVYDTWEYTLNNDKIYFISEEKLETTQIDYNTRSSVYKILNSILYYIGEHQYRAGKDLSIILSGENGHSFEAKARAAFKNYPDEEYLLNTLLDAYMESLLINPCIVLDLNANNFGFTPEGTIKVFDCSIPIETICTPHDNNLVPDFTFNIILAT